MARPVDRVILQHLSDPEQIHIGGLQGAGLLLDDKPTRVVNPRHRRIQGELLDTTRSEQLLHPSPTAPVPNQCRILVAQTL